MRNKLKQIIWRSKDRIRKNLFFARNNLNPKPSKKILVVSLQKSGTHLIKKVMEEAGFHAVEVGTCEMSHFHGLRDDQYLLSHFTPSIAFLMALEEGNQEVYIIFNFRDPRDALTSFFHAYHPNNPKNFHVYMKYLKKVYSNLSDDELLSMYITIDKYREIEYNVLEHFRWNRVLYFHPGVLNVRFEDLVGSKGGGSEERQLKTIEHIMNYLGIDGVDSQQIARNAFDEKSPTFRKGTIGGYKEVLSKEQKKLFNKLHGDIIKQYGYELDNFED